jgi:hypothetical protein
MESWYQRPVQYTNSFSLHTLILFCNLRIWGHMWLFLNNGPHLLAVAIKTLFSTIKLVMRTSAMKILKVNGSFCGTKSMLSILCCCRSDEALSLCVLVNICRFTSASPWWAQLLYSRKQTTHKKFVWELEALTGYLLYHLESNFVLYAAAPLGFSGCFL